MPPGTPNRRGASVSWEQTAGSSTRGLPRSGAARAWTSPQRAASSAGGNARLERGRAFHLWSPEGSAHRAFGRLTGDLERKRRLNSIMREHALAIIRARPLSYARMVGADFLRYFEPGVESRYISDSALSLPASGALMQLDPRVKRSFFPESSRAFTSPRAVRAYHRIVHTPRWLLACLMLLVTFGLLLPVFTRGRMQRMPHVREILLLTGVPIAILIGATATSEFVLRYLVPVAPLILAGGVVAIVDLASLLRRRSGDARNARPRGRCSCPLRAEPTAMGRRSICPRPGGRSRGTARGRRRSPAGPPRARSTRCTAAGRV